VVPRCRGVKLALAGDTMLRRGVAECLDVTNGRRRG